MKDRANEKIKNKDGIRTTILSDKGTPMQTGSPIKAGSRKLRQNQKAGEQIV
jgi:hypothetical protein